MRSARLLLVMAPLLIASCTEAPTQPAAFPDLVAAYDGNSGCYAVKFTSHAEGVFPTFNAVLAGDLVGTALVEFDPASEVATGATNWVNGMGTWNITGGIISELVGQSFTTTTAAKNIFAPDVDPFLFEIVGSDRALSGVEKANLTFRGGFDLGDFVPPFDVDLRWNGVICP